MLRSCVAAIVTTACVCASAHAQMFRADLRGTNEVPGNASPASGVFHAVLTGAPGSFTLAFIGQYQGLAGAYSASHLHQAPAGANGAVVLDLAGFHTAGAIPTTGSHTTGAGSAAISDAVAMAMMAGNIYINVHSTAFPGGEIRGQLNAVPKLFFHADITGSQEVPPVTSQGTGKFDAVLTGTAGAYQVAFTGSYINLSAGYTASHLHNNAFGANGGVVLDLGPFHTPASPNAGSWMGAAAPLTDNIARQMLVSRLYNNVHSMTSPGGEIRGQVVLVEPPDCYADCNNDNTLNIFDYICFGSAFSAGCP